MSSKKIEKKIKEFRELKKKHLPPNLEPTSDLMVDYLKSMSIEECMVFSRDTMRLLELLLDIIEEARGEKPKKKKKIKFSFDSKL
jgi:hypothetical protein